MPGAHQSRPIAPPPQHFFFFLQQGRKNTMKGSWVKIRTGEITHQLPSQAKQIQLEESSLISHQSNQSRIMRNMTNSSKQSFRNRLLQCGSPTGSQVLPANPLHCGLLFPWLQRSCQEPAAVWALHGVAPSFRHPPALAWGFPRTAGGYLLHCGPPWAAGGQPDSPWSSLQAAGERLLQLLEHLLPRLLLHWPSCLQSHFLSHILLLSPAANCRYAVVLNSLKSYHRGATTITDWLSLDQQWVLSWSWLALAPPDAGEASTSTETTPVSPLLPKPCHVVPVHVCMSLSILQILVDQLLLDVMCDTGKLSCYNIRLFTVRCLQRDHNS